MNRCKDCGAPGANFEIHGGEYVCKDCASHYFTCPTCGKLFYRDDYEHGDSGSGHCSKCASA